MSEVEAPDAPAPKTPQQRHDDAVAKLKALEAPKHARDLAGVMVGRKRLLHALDAATPEDVAQAEADHEAAIQAHAEAAVDPRHIDIAAQAVIDARTALEPPEEPDTATGDQP